MADWRCPHPTLIPGLCNDTAIVAHDHTRTYSPAGAPSLLVQRGDIVRVLPSHYRPGDLARVLVNDGEREPMVVLIDRSSLLPNTRWNRARVRVSRFISRLFASDGRSTTGA